MRSHCRLACHPYHIYFIFTKIKNSKKDSWTNITAVGKEEDAGEIIMRIPVRSSNLEMKLHEK